MKDHPPAYQATTPALSVDKAFYRRIAEAPGRKLVEQFVIPIRSGRAWKVPAGDASYSYRKFDHQMLLRHDDPLVKPLQQLGEPVFICESNPTVEHIATLIYKQASKEGLPVVRVKVWETPTSYAEYGE